MKPSWLGVTLLLPFLSACNTSSTIQIDSAHISAEQAEIIKTNILKYYPNSTLDEQQEIADVAVRAIENLVFVEGGSFDMGDFKAPCELPHKTRERIDWSPDHKCYSIFGGSGEENLHKVTLDSYSISKFETTYADMEVMRKVNNLPVADQKLDGSALIRNSEEHIQRLEKLNSYAGFTKTWQESKDYCLWLNQVTDLPFDLPTEAQWEYAARSRGQHYYFATNNGYRQVQGGSYYDPKSGFQVDYSNDEVNASSYIENIDSFPPNPIGVYGMSNQVAEWVNDWYAKDYYLKSPKHNPQGPEVGAEKVQRDGRGVTMTFSRLHSEDYSRYHVGNGFRCALQQTSPVLP